MTARHKSPRDEAGLVLALSGGAAAGIAHIGVLQVLEENAIPVRAVVGTSIGAEIGAFFASGIPLTELTELATAIDWKQTLQLFMPDLTTGGLVSGNKIGDFLQAQLGDRTIDSLPMAYAAMAVDLETGEQVVCDQGSLVDAVRASIALPGLIAPHRINNRWLVDGGILNPVPFDVARERFGGPVLAVAVHAAARRAAQRAKPTPPSSTWPEQVRQLLSQPWMDRAKGLKTWLEAQLENHQPEGGKEEWSTRRVLDQSMIIAQGEIVRLRTAMNPPDLLLLPDVCDIGPLEFYSGKAAIAAGRAAAEANLTEIKNLLVAGKN